MDRSNEKNNSFHTKVAAVFLAMGRPDTPLYAKVAAGMLVYYALSPLDLIPDFIPVLGLADDMVILPFLMWLSFKLVPADIMEECMSRARNMREGTFRQKLRYAIPVILVWAIIIIRASKIVYNRFF